MIEVSWRGHESPTKFKGSSCTYIRLLMATYTRAVRLPKARARVTQKSAGATAPLSAFPSPSRADGIFPRWCCTIVSAISVFSDEQRNEAVAAENELLHDESAGRGSGRSSDDTDSRL